MLDHARYAAETHNHNRGLGIILPLYIPDKQGDSTCFYASLCTVAYLLCCAHLTFLPRAEGSGPIVYSSLLLLGAPCVSYAARMQRLQFCLTYTTAADRWEKKCPGTFPSAILPPGSAYWLFVM